jgi:hypothetical protein
MWWEQPRQAQAAALGCDSREGPVRLYTTVVVGGFRRYATHRVATAAGVFTNTVFGLVISYTCIALWDQRPHLGRYDQSQALTCVPIGQALFAADRLPRSSGRRRIPRPTPTHTSGPVTCHLTCGRDGIGETCWV